MGGICSIHGTETGILKLPGCWNKHFLKKWEYLEKWPIFFSSVNCKSYK
jgi:hypothetical protein